jgi:hypothetical protein
VRSDQSDLHQRCGYHDALRGVTNTIDLGVSSLREHRAYNQALGTDFDPDDFLRSVTGCVGIVAGCDFAVLFQAFNVV